MCDFSLQAVKSRPAKVGDKLTTKNWGTGTGGFCAVDDTDCAVCVLPGTEIAFDEPFQTNAGMWAFGKKHTKVAIFRQINKHTTHMHHDALETPAGDQVLLTNLIPGQSAVVLQLPAAPKTDKEAEEQTRLVIAG